MCVGERLREKRAREREIKRVLGEFLFVELCPNYKTKIVHYVCLLVMGKV